ncbi:MAG: ATP-binding protein [Pseudorhodobacter sp.]
MSEAVNRLNSYHVVLTWMIQRFEYDGVEKIGKLIEEDRSVFAYRVTNRFGKVLLQAGDLEAGMATHDYIEREVLDRSDPSFVDARAIYVLEIPEFFEMVMDRIREVILIGLFFALLIAVETHRRLSRTIVKPLETLYKAVEDHTATDRWAAPGIDRPTEIAELEQEIGRAFDDTKEANDRITHNIDAVTRVQGNFGRAIRYFDRHGNVIDFGTMEGSPVETAIPVSAAGGQVALMADMRARNRLPNVKTTEADLSIGAPQDALLQFDHELKDETFFTVTLIGLDEGEFAIVLADVTARKRLETLSNRQQKFEAIGQLAGGIAHDFNNLICVIQMSADMLETQHGVKPEQLSSILTACRRGARLTQGLLSFGRVSKLEARPLNLNEMASNLLNWSHSILPANILVETAFDKDAWTVIADPAMAENALLNLILNARDAMPGGGNLTIETANLNADGSYISSRFEAIAEGRYVVLSVSDTGHGINADDLDRIFDPFFTTKAPGKGSGVGLSMVLGFIRQSGGAVRVYSEPGNGTSFRLFFPATSQNPAPPTTDDQAGLDPVRPGKILLVEDEDDLRGLLRVHLENSGHQVEAAQNADEALAIFSEYPDIDLLITDIIMPGPRNGVQLCAKLRRKKPDLGVILLSGYSQESIVHGAGGRADDIRLTKPVRRKDLILAVNKVLQNRANQPQ